MWYRILYLVLVHIRINAGLANKGPFPAKCPWKTSTQRLSVAPSAKLAARFGNANEVEGSRS